VKCHVQNIHTMDELKMTGNCLKGSRGLVAFDGNWQGEEWKSLTKELLTHVRWYLGRLISRRYRIVADEQAFSVPKTSRRLKPFIDHIMLFSILDNRIWFRNYQVSEPSRHSSPHPKGPCPPVHCQTTPLET